ncbi:arsenite efflux ATP-binding protein ArsA [Antricoccus suffuscus]|uniref:arsenite-transporting ATPase n=1 Tax=Antricoccus suffuscus TaxID=1629062 RepID=A0A2T0ZYF1_9ACTN|nr:ArsA family ATPase [Antricoccus suffuscus]PRZ41370.1 arsenite efflux ATP-binding protein ArsA [Antricoccus suffuscus]
MRIVLFTGKGGVGKTTTALATAVHAAGLGCKTLLMSTDPAHSVGDALSISVRDVPTQVDDGLYVMHVDAQRRFESSWGELQGYVRALLTNAGADPLTADEIAVVPGVEEFMALLALREQAVAGLWDFIVVDCAPTAETLRLLALPQVLSWYAERLFPTHNRMLRHLAPLAGRMRDVPMPSAALVSAFSALHQQVDELCELLGDAATTTVRLVLTPEAVVLAEARRTLSSLRLYGYPVDGIVVNRLIPPGGKDPWRASWVAAQREQMTRIADSFDRLPIRTLDYQRAEPVGLDALRVLGVELYADTDPREGPATADVVRIEHVRDDELPGGYEFTMILDLPHLDRADVQLARSADDLVVTAAGRRRYVGLPSALRRCDVVGAAYADNALRVTFTPNPELWPRS